MTPVGGLPVDVSVVVPFRNGAHELSELLDSLVSQTHGRRWEVITVNNGSTDEAADVASGYGGRLPLLVIDACDRASPGYARNAGVRASRGQKLLFVDADDVVAPNYVSAMSQALDSWPFVTSRVDSEQLNPQWVRRAHGGPWQEDGIASFLGFLPGTGSNIGIRRELFERLGGFSEVLQGSEDLAFSWTAQLDAGIEPRFVPEALYLYRYRRTLRALFRQGARWGRDHVRLYRTFRPRGMPGRPMMTAAREWGSALGGLIVAAGSDRPALVVRLGYCCGRLAGSVQERLLYL